MDAIARLTKHAIDRRGLNEAEAFELLEEGATRPFAVIAAAGEIRDTFKGKTVHLCGITNAKSGKCSENCRFCAQSSHYATQASIYPLKSAETIIAEAKAARDAGATLFGIVTSGKKIATQEEWETIYRAIEGIRALGMTACGSLGMLDRKEADALKAAGLGRFHHNLETSRSFFPSICTTHAYDDDIQTIKNVQAAGMSICSGGLFGLGESMAQRVEMALTLQELNVDSIPLNLLTPIPGTPLENAAPVPPVEILLSIAAYRFILPDRDIRVCGGKEKNLRQLLPMLLVAGCNGMMTGNYLTTTGRNTAMDLEMIFDLGMTPSGAPRCACDADGNNA